MLRFLLSIIITLSFSAAAVAASEPESENYTFGIWTNMGSGMDSQAKTIFGDIMAIASDIAGIDISFLWFQDRDEFMRAVGDGKIDIAIVSSWFESYNLIRKHNYSAIQAHSFYGKKKYRACLYVNSKNGAESVPDLKGQSAIIFNNPEEYFILRSMIGQKPEEYFSKLTSTPNGISAIYALSLNDHEVAFVNNIYMEIMKTTNPGPTKNIRELMCSESFYHVPSVRSPGTPKNVTDKLVKIFGGIRKEEAFSKYRQLLKTMKFRTLPVVLEDYDYLFGIFDKALEKGWDKDYEKWIAATKENN